MNDKREIWKYDFEISDDYQVKEMPSGAEILRVASQDSVLTMWAMVIRKRALESRTFRVYGTGQPIAPDDRYIGTADIRPFVWHLFEARR